jgi:NitT/TauT family transport system substrate-binding protein
VGFLLGIGLFACSPASVTQTQPAIERVSLQLQWVTQAQFAGYYVALDKGWYLEEGIELTIVPGAPDVSAIDLVLSESRQFGTSLLADLAVQVQQGRPLKSVAQIQQKNGLLLVARKGSGIERPQDFRGKRVGVWLGNWQAQFDSLMANAGINREEFELVSQGYSMAPFLNGELDVASAMIYNEYYSVLESGVSADELLIIDYADYGLGFPGDALFTSLRMIEQKPDLVAKMVRASLRGWKFAIENPEEAVEIVLKYDDTQMQTQQHQMSMMLEIAKLVVIGDHPIGQTDEVAAASMLTTLLQYGILTSPVDPQSLYTNQFRVDVTP